LFAQLSHAEIFQCIDGGGHTVFRDSECGPGETLHKRMDSDGLETKTGNGETGNDTDIIVSYHGDPGVLGKNLLRNPSFENRLVDWRVPLGASWLENQGFKGSGALMIHAKEPPHDRFIHETVVSQCVLLGKGEKFGLSARFRLDKIPAEKVANRANIIWYESSNCSTGGQYGWYIEPENVKGWQMLSSNSLTPALGAKAAMITIVQNGRYSNGGRGIWDDVVFAATELFERSDTNIDREDNSQYTLGPGINYVSNGRFDNSITSWREGWKTVWSGSEGDTSPGSARVTSHSVYRGSGRGAISQCVNIGDNTTFEMGASFKKDPRSTQAGGGRFRVSWHEEMNCFGRSKIDGKSADPEAK